MEGGKKRPAPQATADKRGGKRTKATWRQAAFKRKGAEAGHKGVMITCAKNRESETIREVYTLLNEYADELYPLNEEDQSSEAASAGDSLEQEIAALKDKQEKGEAQRFYCLETNVKGVILIKFTDDRIEPVQFVNHIFDDLVKKKVQKTRFAVRMIPIQKTCTARLEKIVDAAEDLITPHFAFDTTKRFSVLFKSRHNDIVKRMDCINGLVKIVGTEGDHRVELKNPDTVIIVEIFQIACGLSVISNGEYGRYDGYNIRKVCEEMQTEKKPPKPPVPAGARQPQKQDEKKDTKKENEKKEEEEKGQEEEKEEEEEVKEQEKEKPQTILVKEKTKDEEPEEEEEEDDGLGAIKLF